MENNKKVFNLNKNNFSFNDENQILKSNNKINIFDVICIII